MSLPKAATALSGAILAGCLFVPSALAATPAWSIQSFASPTNFEPGDESGLDSYQVHITNSGGETTDRSPVTIVDTLPEGLTVKDLQLYAPRGGTISAACKAEEAGEAATVTCNVTEALRPEILPAELYSGDELSLAIKVATPVAADGALVNRVKVEGGGAQPATLEAKNQASSAATPAGFEEFHAALTGPDGHSATSANSHPYQYTTSFAVNLNPSPPGLGLSP